MLEVSTDVLLESRAQVLAAPLLILLPVDRLPKRRQLMMAPVPESPPLVCETPVQFPVWEPGPAPAVAATRGIDQDM